MGSSKNMYEYPSLTQDLEVQEENWEQQSSLEDFEKKQETFSLRVDRVLQEQEELFRHQREKKNKILKRATIPYLDPDVPEIEINRLNSGRWEAKVTLSGGGETTSLAIRDLVSATLKMLEEII